MKYFQILGTDEDDALLELFYSEDKENIMQAIFLVDTLTIDLPKKKRFQIINDLLINLLIKGIYEIPRNPTYAPSWSTLHKKLKKNLMVYKQLTFEFLLMQEEFKTPFRIWNNFDGALELSGLNVGELPDSIGYLTNLKYLDITAMGLVRLPDTIGNLKNLEDLDASFNVLTELPNSIGKLKYLSGLTLMTNDITKLPNSIGKLEYLEDLAVGDNKLTELPNSIGKLTELDSLSIFINPLVTLPNSIGKLKDNLRNIDMQKTNISTEERHRIQEMLPDTYVTW